MESPELIGPTVLAVVERVTSGLDHARAEYYDEFKMIVLRQAQEKLEREDEQEVIRYANESLAALSRWAFSGGSRR